jgi:hypothetical protein
MADKRTFEANCFACKTFACASFTNNQQQIEFIQARTIVQPTSAAYVETTTYPTNFSVIYVGPWTQANARTGINLLVGRTMSSGSNTLLAKRTLDEPTSTTLNNLILLGMSTSTSVVLGMGVSGVTSNVQQPEAFNARLMKEPT